MMPDHVKELRRAQRAVDRIPQVLDRRDQAIRQCVALGMTHAQVHRALDGKLTRGRIGQVMMEANHEDPEIASRRHAGVGGMILPG